MMRFIEVRDPLYGDIDMLLGKCYTLYDRINRTIQRPETKEKERKREREGERER
jgi:hypothetical protein